MAATRRQHTGEYKREAVRLASEPGSTISGLAKGPVAASKARSRIGSRANPRDHDRLHGLGSTINSRHRRQREDWWAPRESNSAPTDYERIEVNTNLSLSTRKDTTFSTCPRWDIKNRTQTELAGALPSEI